MSFGQKPTAWARQPGPAPNQQLNPNLFTNQLGLAAGQPFATMPTMSLGSSLNALVNQAAFSNMNNVLAQAQVAQRAQQLMPQSVAPQHARQASPPPVKNQRTFLGTVTKLMETYGFVDEDVFFQTNVIRGTVPRVGDRVMVEASFNPSMPFKWNAYRIQLAQAQDSMPPQQQQQQPQQSQMYSSRVGQAPPQVHPAGGTSNRWSAQSSDRRDDNRGGLQMSSAADRGVSHSNHRQPSTHRRSSPPANAGRRSPVNRHRSPARRSPSRKSSPVRSSNKREREKSMQRESREPTRTRSPTATKEVSKRDDASPPRRRQRIIPRYHCRIPKQIVQSNALKYLDLRKRYSTMYIPSDFIRCDMSWLKSIQLDEPIKFSPHPITYSVLHKDVDLEGLNPTEENPPDADSRYTVKVLLLAQPGQSALRQKVYGLLPDGSIDEFVETQSLLKNLQFLVGSRGKSEFMCVGGPWSPSLDGENAMDPQTVVNTAIRTTRALTGVDLSSCSKWYKMVHLHYYRVERNRVDSVVLMMPDPSCPLMPSVTAFAETEQLLKEQLANKLAAIDAEPFPLELASGSESLDSAAVTATTAIAAATNAESAANGVSEGNTTEGSQPGEQAEGNTEKAADESRLAKKKTSWSQLIIKNLKVVELREELDARGIDSKGVKNTLCQRLQEAIDKEKAEEEANASSKITDSATSSSEPAGLNAVETGEEQMDTADKPAEELIAAEELVEKVDDAAAAERAEKELKELEKAKEKFEKEKKERKVALERHFSSIPKEPTVLIYPSKNAKSGKFDCKCSSLSALLDYRQDDNKEASFEVFLFAEALREAIDRSNAFLVYHAIDSSLPRDIERKRRDEVLTSEAPVVAKEEEGAEAASNGDVQMETNAAVEKEEEVEDKKLPAADLRTKYKAFVHDVDMFSAFAHFDENVCGYLEDRDLEEILHTLGIDLSRGELQRLIKKLSSRERVNYRNLTDRWVDKEGNVKYVPSSASEARSLSELAVGHALSLEEVGTEKSQSGQQPTVGSTPDVTDTGVVFYKGSVLNIAQSMEQQKGVESERNAALLKNEQLELQLKTTKEQRDYFEKKKRRLEDDLDRYKKKLHEAEKSLKNSQEDTVLMKASLQDCKRFSERITLIVEKLNPPPKKEEKVSKKGDMPKEESVQKLDKTEKTAGEQSEDSLQKLETPTEEEMYEVRDEELEPEGNEQAPQEAVLIEKTTSETTGQS